MGTCSFNVRNVAPQRLFNRAFRDVTADGNTYGYDDFQTGQSTGGMPLARPGGVVRLSMPAARC